MRRTMGNRLAFSEAELDLPRHAPAGQYDALTERFFVLHHQRPERLRDIPLAGMDADLRSLLFTDGTVTRTLEAQTLRRVRVEVVDQAECQVLGLGARHLVAPATTAAVRRRVTIGIDGMVAPLIWAESHLLPDRLPAGFIGLLDQTPDGIGESLQQIKLEGWREMLWFGLDAAPCWDERAAQAAPAFLTRLYRVITAGQPALLISESFAVTSRDGVHRLALAS